MWLCYTETFLVDTKILNPYNFHLAWNSILIFHPAIQKNVKKKKKVEK